MIRLRSFLSDQHAAAAAEFALVLPLALLFLFGIIDAGRYAWALNQYEKAVQIGTRYAIVTDIVPPGLNDADFSGITCDGTATSTGSRICQDALGTISCSKPAGTLRCDCVQTVVGAKSCPPLGTPNGTAFTAIVDRMQAVAPGLDESKVIVRYSGSGIGYVGDSSTSTFDNDVDLTDVAPLVTIEIAGQQFRPMSMLGLGVGMPTFRYSMTMEDGDGTKAFY